MKKILAVTVLSLIIPFSSFASENGIKVVGTSEVSVAPDIAKFTLAISERGDNLPPLKREIDKKTTNIIALCKILGVETQNISSAEVSIHPQYNYQTKEFLGYEVSRIIKITLTELEKYTDLVNGSIDSGITTINSISLDITKRDELELQALEEASKSAKNKALALAESNGLSLGPVLSIDEGGIPSEQVRYLYAEKRRMAANVGQESGAFEPGEISVSATVIVKYSIK